jgi:CMP-N,N'-diacetyllegionaminic acid synthase
MKDIVLGVIPARGNSRRVPRKNIKMLGGHELIWWTIEAAKKSRTLDYFLVSTDDEEIAKVSRRYGAPVPFKRPAELGVDCDSTLVLQHAVRKVEGKGLCDMRSHIATEDVRVSHVVCLQPTSPFRTATDIDECVRIAKATNAESVISFKPVKEHPLWCFQTKAYGHEMEPFLHEIELKGENLVIQNLPFLFYPNGAVYVTRRDVLIDRKSVV